METLVKGVRSKSRNVTCKDGNASCDFDTTSGTCTFAIALCFNEPGCSASGVTKVVARGPAAGTVLQGVAGLAASNRVGNATAFAAPFTTSASCTDLMAVTVATKKHGRKPGKMKLGLTAFGSSKRTKDPDAIKLICVP
jgi:hypothetical protein